MLNKKLIVLASAYIAWVFVWILHNKKNPSDLKKELNNSKESKDEYKVLFDNFVEVHKDLIESLKTKTMTPENIEFINQKKDLLINVLNDYKTEAETILSEFREKGSDYVNTSLKKLEKSYKEKLNELDKIKTDYPEKVEEIKEKLITYFDEIQNKLKK